MLKFPISYKYQLVAIIQVSQYYSPLAMSTCHIIFPTSYAILTFSLREFYFNPQEWRIATETGQTCEAFAIYTVYIAVQSIDADTDGEKKKRNDLIFIAYNCCALRKRAIKVHRVPK